MDALVFGPPGDFPRCTTCGMPVQYQRYPPGDWAQWEHLWPGPEDKHRPRVPDSTPKAGGRNSTWWDR